MDEKRDPITSMNEGAVVAHELYLSYIQAGFTEEQALQIVIAMMVNANSSRD